MRIKGSLLCDACCPTNQRVILGRTKDEQIPMDGGRVLQFPDTEVSVSTVLRDITGYGPSGFYRLSCGHLRAFPLFLMSAQEWIQSPDGTRTGDGLPLAECLK